MLKRIKVRGKLLLLLATPLIAVMVFAYSGIVDRTDRTAFQEGEARIAELAGAGSDLSLAIQVERIRVLEVERLVNETGELTGPEQANTDAQLVRWLEAVDAARGDLTDPTLIAELDDLAERLPTTISPDRGNDSVAGTLLASAGRAVDEATVSLAGEARDLDLFRALTDLNLLINVQSSYATITSVGSEAIFQGELSAVAATLVAEAAQTAQTDVAIFDGSADVAYTTTLERLQNSGVLPKPTSGPVDAVADIRDFIRDSGNGGVSAWLLQGEDQLTALNGLSNDLTTDATDASRDAASAAAEEARSFAILAGSVILLALAMAVIIGRSISRPLIRLTRSAEQLSSEELPALVESMRSAGRTEAPVLTPIEAKGRDEVAQLAHAISEIQQVTIDVAEEQGDLLRRGISDIFVNLARRNQSLLDRQIDFIDQLESREENPDQLENLFRLDHLATRMRRNAESLLVLAGAEPARRRGTPVEIVDVLRVAMGEIEDFGRIQMTSVDPSTVAGSVAVDLAHLMSELMENATQFSPPDTPVEAVGYRIADDSYQLTLADLGIGMSAEQIASANSTLAEPPLVGLDLSRSLGFTVVSRLAHRLGVSVQLMSGAQGGVTAVVTIPAEMIGSATDHPVAFLPDEPVVVAEVAPAAAAAPATEPAPQPTRDNPWGRSTSSREALPVALVPAASQQDTDEPVPTAGDSGLSTLATRHPANRPTADAPPEETSIPQPEPSPFAVPVARSADSDLFAAFGTPSTVPNGPADEATDLFAAIDGDRTPPPPEPGGHHDLAPEPTEANPATEPVAEPVPVPSRDPAAVGTVSAEVTSAGLIRRTPKRVNVPVESRFAAATPSATEASASTAQRSPDEVRQMLSRYRAGLRKGHTPESGTDQSKRRS